MKLVDNWKFIISKAWSARLALLSAALGALYLAWPALQGAVSVQVYVGGFVVVGLLGALSRIIDQKDI